MVYQDSKSGCGKACVRDVISLVFEDESYRHQPLDSQCQNFYEMKEALATNGLDYVGYELWDFEVLEKENFPLICQLSYNEVSHFVVVKKIVKGKYYLDDPQFGRLILKEDEFKECYCGKALIKEKVKEKPKPEVIKLFPIWAKISFTALFLLEAASFFLFFYFMNQSDAIFFSMIFGIAALIFIFLQLLVSNKIRNLFDTRIFVPYLKETKDPDDAKPLSKYLNYQVERANKLVSYGLIAFLICLVLTSNGFYLSVLSVLAILIGISEVYIESERNKVDRYCSIKEQTFFKGLNYGDKCSESPYEDAKEKAQNFRNKSLLLKALEVIFYSLLIFIFMSLTDYYSLNFFLFHLVILISLQGAANRLVISYIDDTEEVILLNRLSYPLSRFILKNNLTLGYTNNVGGKPNEEAQTSAGLSGQDKTEE